MKTPLLCLALSALPLGPLNAQLQLEEQLAAKLKPAPAQFGEVSEADKKIVIQKIAALLGEHVTFRPDGTASTYYDSPTGRQFVEWQNLHLKMLIPTPLQATDEAQGVKKRIQALVGYDASRLLDPKTNSWTAWGARSHPLFPPAINVAWKNGHPMADGGMHLARFMKGPLTSQATAVVQPDTSTAPAGTTPGNRPPTQGTMKPATGSGGLPPGMSKGK